LIVQHMPPMFTASLAKSLDKHALLRVSEGAEGETIAAGNVYIAPGGNHMVLARRGGAQVFQIALNEDPPENNCRPAVDVLFRSAAEHVGAGVLSVIMTGMGADGCHGVRAIRGRGGTCLAQDAASSVVYGMPRAVTEAGLVDEVVPLGALAERISACAGCS
jgi:two-component system chemotaxis response regulator CheB